MKKYNGLKIRAGYNSLCEITARMTIAGGVKIFEWRLTEGGKKQAVSVTQVFFVEKGWFNFT